MKPIKDMLNYRDYESFCSSFKKVICGDTNGFDFKRFVEECYWNEDVRNINFLKENNEKVWLAVERFFFKRVDEGVMNFGILSEVLCSLIDNYEPNDKDVSCLSNRETSAFLDLFYNYVVNAINETAYDFGIDIKDLT